MKTTRINFQLKNSCTFLTGIKPSGNIHLGNYIGCLYPLINLEAKKKNTKFVKKKHHHIAKLRKIILIADLHCLTNINSLFSLRKNVYDLTKAIISLIIDIYLQKKKYIDIYINDIKLKNIIRYIKSNKSYDTSNSFYNETNNNSNNNSSNNSNSNNNSNNNNNNLLYYDTSCNNPSDILQLKQKNILNKIGIAFYKQNKILYNDKNNKLNKNFEDRDKKKNDKYKKIYVKNKVFQKHYYYIFKQSDIQAHTSLYYIINTFTSVNLLNSHIHVKVSEKNKSLALLSYPNLMLSDVLLYKPDYLIIGIDQNKNIEIMKKITKKINNTFPNTTKIPKIFDSKFHMQIMSLDGTNKMSKSQKLIKNENVHKIIYIFDKKSTIEEKIKKSKTDNYNTLIYAQEERKEINNLINLFIFFYYYHIKNIYTKRKKTYIKNLYQLVYNNIILNKIYTKFKKQMIDTCLPDFQNNININNLHSYSYHLIKEELFIKNKNLSNINQNNLFYHKNNINPNFNINTINDILLFYNNNYSIFKSELAQLIYKHFLPSKLLYNVIYSYDNLINHLLKNGKRCMSKIATQTFKVNKYN
ncbi:tryptophan--tRNA ligase, putative [Hepatocystis sp. ex Piliocolobus tephrosceles]|nr:tryptophan--tRNA ligase, putative [Hepatocystis sp. ex Piliocolobus tephrosceles]